MFTRSAWQGLLLSIFLPSFLSSGLLAQSPSGTSGANSVRPNAYTNNELDRRLWTLSFEKKLSPEARKKLFYFDHWEAKGIINGKYKIDNVNYSLHDDALVYRVAKDSLFLFDKQSVDYFTINHKAFKRYYLGGDMGNVYLELLFKSSDENTQLLKRQYITTSQGDVDPLMMKKTTIKITRNKAYYLVRDGGYPVKIRLAKKDILARFPKRKKDLLEFASTENLSFRKEEDVLKILNNLNSTGTKAMK
ncbi:MAG: hypothetical protein AB3N14_13725 [Flavobacteriaceae bacterium]